MLQDQVLDNVSDAIISLDESWMIAHVNRPAEMLLRQRASEITGRTVWELFPDIEGTPAEQSLRRAHADRIAVRYEQFLPSLYAWHEVRAVPVEDGLMLFVRDITDRTRLLQDDAVRARLQQILEHAPVAVSIFRGADHRIEMQNAMARRLIGGRELEGMTIRNAFPELEGQGFFELLDEVYRTGQPYEGYELPARFDRLGDGTMYEGCFNVIYQPVFDTSGRVSGILSLSVEVTDLVSQRQEMRRASAERKAILEQLGVGVIVTDAQGRITFVNEVATALHGVAQLDVAPDQYTETYHLLTEQGEPYPTEELPLSRAVLREETVSAARWRIRRPDGEVILVEGSARPVYDEEEKRLGAVLTMREVEPTAEQGR